MQTVQLQVADEVKALGDSLKALIVDIKAKKSTTAIVADVLPGVVSAVGNYASIGADIKTADDQTYLLGCILSGLEG